MSGLPHKPDAGLYRDVREILLTARATVRRAVNDAMVQAYWQIGRLIVEDEQGGERRAEYGGRVLHELSQRLTAEFGKGFTLSNLRNFRQFFLNFSWEEICYTPCSELTWPHFRMLARVDADFVGHVMSFGSIRGGEVRHAWSA